MGTKFGKWDRAGCATAAVVCYSPHDYNFSQNKRAKEREHDMEIEALDPPATTRDTALVAKLVYLTNFITCTTNRPTPAVVVFGSILSYHTDG